MPKPSSSPLLFGSSSSSMNSSPLLKSDLKQPTPIKTQTSFLSSSLPYPNKSPNATLLFSSYPCNSAPNPTHSTSILASPNAKHLHYQSRAPHPLFSPESCQVDHPPPPSIPLKPAATRAPPHPPYVRRRSHHSRSHREPPPPLLPVFVFEGHPSHNGFVLLSFLDEKQNMRPSHLPRRRRAAQEQKPIAEPSLLLYLRCFFSQPLR